MNILTMSQDSTESIEATYIELWEDAIGTSEMFEASSQCHSLTHSLTHSWYSEASSCDHGGESSEIRSISLVRDSGNGALD